VRSGGIHLLYAWLLFALIALMVLGCQPPQRPPLPIGPLPETYTYHRPDGNRVVSGRGALPDVLPVDIPLGGQPDWVVGAPIKGGSLWAAVLDDGTVIAFSVIEGQAESIAVMPENLPPGMPPLLIIEDGQPELVTPPTTSASVSTHPVVLSSGKLAFVADSGDLAIHKDGQVTRLALNCLPDARILTDENDRLLLLTGATRRYEHGVLGDDVEAASISLIETDKIPQVGLTIPIPGDSVVEGIAPIWADLTGDGAREIVVTVSNARQGAQIIAFDASGDQLASGPDIGTGFRWRHQLAVAPFGPNGETELAAVLTPHIGGIVEFYSMEGESLSIVATVAGYTSHVIHSRNLDMAVAGDFDGDGQLELLLPDQGRNVLGAIRRTTGGAEVAWSLPVEGKVSTNIAAVMLDDGGLAVAVGREDDVLRVWQP
jgi:hypothetical protein